MSSPASRVTIEDVAAEASVSVATVSRALRGFTNVAPSTRDRVIEAAARLDYQPDPNASRLARGRSGAVAVAIPMLTGWYFSQVVAGVEAVVKESGYDLLVSGIGDEEVRQRFLSGRAPLSKRVDGFVMVDLRLSPADAAALASNGVAASTVGFRTSQYPSVTLDDIAVARLATEHLLDLGHRRIGLIAGNSSETLRFIVPDRRRTGYLDALQAAGVDPDPELVGIGDFSIEGGVEAMVALMKLENPPTAVFAMSDEMAFGALQTAREMELSVPGDVSVIGVDDHDLAPVMGLTTVKQKVVENGAIAARLLLSAIADPEEPTPHCLAEFELVVRGTTAGLG